LIEKASTNEGTTVIVDSTAATEVAAVGIWYTFGSRDEIEEMQGSTHFIEHMLFKGTSRRSPFQIAQEIDRLGGQINAATERECVYFFSSVPAESFETAGEILIDLINNASFKIEDFYRERVVIENELVAAEDDPEEHAGEIFYKRLWGKHPLARPIGGSIPILKNIKHEDIINIYSNQYKSSPPLITVAGDLSVDRVLKTFSGVFHQPSDQIHRITPNKPFIGAPYYTISAHQNIQIFCTFNNYPKISRQEYYALLIANTALGDSMSSRLFQALRENLGLCYNIYSMPSFFSDLTDWTIYASTTNASITKFIYALSKELHTIFEFGLSNVEIMNAKSHLIGSMKFDSIDVEHRMHRIARQWMSDSIPISMIQSQIYLNSMSNESINALIKRFMSDGAILYGVGPARAESSFCKAARSFFTC